MNNNNNENLHIDSQSNNSQSNQYNGNGFNYNSNHQINDYSQNSISNNQYSNQNVVTQQHQNIGNSFEQVSNPLMTNQTANGIYNRTNISQQQYQDTDYAANTVQQSNIRTPNNQYNVLKLIQIHKKKIIIAVIILILLVLLLTIFNKNSTGKNGYTEIVNGTLKIYEKHQMLHIKTISSLEKYTDNEHLLCDGDYIKLKVSVENPTTTDLSFALIKFGLTDQRKSKLYMTNPFCIFDDSILNKKIASGETGEGYLYFYSNIDENAGNYITDYNNMDKIKYLTVSVISEIEKIGDSGYNYTYEDYYLEVK